MHWQLAELRFKIFLVTKKFMVLVLETIINIITPTCSLPSLSEELSGFKLVLGSTNNEKGKKHEKKE